MKISRYTGKRRFQKSGNSCFSHYLLFYAKQYGILNDYQREGPRPYISPLTRNGIKKSSCLSFNPLVHQPPYIKTWLPATDFASTKGQALLSHHAFFPSPNSGYQKKQLIKQNCLLLIRPNVHCIPGPCNKKGISLLSIAL